VKRWVKILLTAAAALACMPAAAMAAKRLPHIRLEAPPTAVEGDSLTVTVSCRAMRTCAFTGGFSFDTDRLEVQQVTAADTPLLQDALWEASTPEQANNTGKVGLYAVHNVEAA